MDGAALGCAAAAPDCSAAVPVCPFAACSACLAAPSTAPSPRRSCRASPEPTTAVAQEPAASAAARASRPCPGLERGCRRMKTTPLQASLTCDRRRGLPGCSCVPLAVRIPVPSSDGSGCSPAPSTAAESPWAPSGAPCSAQEWLLAPLTVTEVSAWPGEVFADPSRLSKHRRMADSASFVADIRLHRDEQWIDRGWNSARPRCPCRVHCVPGWGL